MDVLEKIAKQYSVSVKDILGTSRKSEYNIPRQIAMYVIRKKFNKPYEDIGAIFSNRNHATVIHAIKKIKKDTTLQQQLQNII